VGNDYSYQEIYARIVKAKGRNGDVLVAISTSGNSQNVLNAIQQAKEQEMLIVGLSGETGGKMKEMCDYLISVPSQDTPRIQESHILIGHIICQLVEEELFPQNR
jgi:D-sedoheptulose 7-phosphate isomerase